MKRDIVSVCPLSVRLSVRVSVRLSIYIFSYSVDEQLSADYRENVRANRPFQ